MAIFFIYLFTYSSSFLKWIKDIIEKKVFGKFGYKEIKGGWNVNENRKGHYINFANKIRIKANEQTNKEKKTMDTKSYVTKQHFL